MLCFIMDTRFSMNIDRIGHSFIHCIKYTAKGVNKREHSAILNGGI